MWHDGWTFKLSSRFKVIITYNVVPWQTNNTNPLRYQQQQPNGRGCVVIRGSCLFMSCRIAVLEGDMFKDFLVRAFKLEEHLSKPLAELIDGKDIDREVELMSLGQLKRVFAACGKELRKRTP
jgi:hypothetical protein